jgi:hypothetical protein
MQIEIVFATGDIQAVRDVVARTANHPIVVDRQHRNVDRHDIEMSRPAIWAKLIGCLLTTQQKSSQGSSVQRFLESKSPLLSLPECEQAKDIAGLARAELTAFGGIRRTERIPGEIASNLRWLTKGGWGVIEATMAPLQSGPQPKQIERDCAVWVDKWLWGFGPKQSRNLLQWLGLTRYEIPIDSRIVKWLKDLGRPDDLHLLSAGALADTEYYCCVLDAVQSLCERAGILPCIFDAAVFASFEAPLAQPG